MTCNLHLNQQRWWRHHDEVTRTVPGLVPVIKSNGYGFSFPTVVAASQRLGVETVAVGDATEVSEARTAGWAGTILLLHWAGLSSIERDLAGDQHIIVTVTSLDALRRLIDLSPQARYLVAGQTSLHGLGISPDQFGDVSELIGDDDRFAGWSFHLPMPAAGDNLAEARRLIAAARSHRNAPMWLSHLDLADYRQLADEFDVEMHYRMGTQLWLGDNSFFRPFGTVLQVSEVKRGERHGYWQQRVPRDGTLLIISGGTSHGVAMRSTQPIRGWRRWLIAHAELAQATLGRVRSPFKIPGYRKSYLLTRRTPTIRWCMFPARSRSSPAMRWRSGCAV